MKTLITTCAELPTIQDLKSQESWGQRGRLLHQAKTRHQWAKRGDHTFGRFIQNCSRNLGVHETALWRDLGAYTYFTESLLPKLGEATPVLEEVEQVFKKVSPEHFVILERIERVSPYPDFVKLAIQVVNGEVPRATLRVYWDSLKPALKGKAARGSNEKPRAEGPVVEEMIRATLTKADPVWTGIANPFAFEVFVGDDTLQLDLHGLTFYRPDAIAVVQETASVRPIFHAATVRSGLLRGENPDFLAAVECFDYFWLAMPDLYDIPYNSSDFHLPDTIGLLRVNSDQVEVVRRPSWDIADQNNGSVVKRANHSGTRIGEVAIALLSKRLKRQ